HDRRVSGGIVLQDRMTPLVGPTVDLGLRAPQALRDAVLPGVALADPDEQAVVIDLELVRRHAFRQLAVIAQEVSPVHRAEGFARAAEELVRAARAVAGTIELGDPVLR